MMSDCGDRSYMLDGERNTESPKASSDLGTRPRTLSRKALQNATERKRHVVSTLHDKLKQMIRSVGEGKQAHNLNNILSDLVTITKDLKAALTELENLYANDKYGDYKGETSITNERWTINRAEALIEEIKHKEAEKLAETYSCQSRRSRRSNSTSSNSTSSSAARMKALAEAAAARENAQFERLIAEKQHAHKEREAEIERKRQLERTEHERELSILAANRKVAVADAKLKAIERVIEEEENETKDEISEMPKLKSEVRTEDWVRTNFTVHNPPQETEVTHQRHKNPPRKIYADNPREPERPNHINFSPNGLLASSTPILEASVSHLIESLASSNKKVVAGLSRQNLPKCHPDTFSGDPTLFHPWKEAFKATINDAEVSPMQEINYLRRFTSGEPQHLVDNYRIIIVAFVRELMPPGSPRQNRLGI